MNAQMRQFYLFCAPLCLFWFISVPAFAQLESSWQLRGSASAGLVASDDQQTVLGYDFPLVDIELRAGWVVHELLVLEARVGSAVFFSSWSDPGALLDASLGTELGGDIDAGRVWGSVHMGAGLTGTLVRPVLRLSLGFDAEVSEDFSVGPVLGFHQLFQWDEDGLTDDARFATLGLSVRLHPNPAMESPPEPPPPPTLETPPAPPSQPPQPEAHLSSEVQPASQPLDPPNDEILNMLDEAAGLDSRELLVPVLFHFDSAELVACSVQSLHALGDHLRAHPEIQLLAIEGHADGSGSATYNHRLSEQRAHVIRDWLIAHGVAPERLAVEVHGESAPVEENNSEEGRAQNRRARFVIVREQ